MRNERETSEANESASIEGEAALSAATDAAKESAKESAKEAERASGPVRRARGAAPKRKSGSPTTSLDAAMKAPKTKARSARKTARSGEDAAKAASDENPAIVSPAADSIPPLFACASTLPFGERPTPTEPGPTEDEERTTDPTPATLDDDAEVFFKAAEASAANDRADAHAAESLAPIEHDVRDAHTLSPHVHLRRAKLAKYVRAAVALSAALCLAAVVRGAIARVTHEHEATAHAMTSDIGRVVVAHQAPHDVEAAITSARGTSAPAASAPAASPIAAAQIDSNASPNAAPGASVAVDATPAKSAAEEKKSTRIALERGKLKDAIAAGERSIALDPTDGETWLLLGAAYQDSGKSLDARRCVVECAKQGKRGPINECRMMLR